MAVAGLFVGTVFGAAKRTATTIADALMAKGVETVLFEPGSVADINRCDIILICTSTTGEGELPVELEDLWYQLRDTCPPLQHKRFAVFCLGDRSYGDTYCGAGHKMNDLLAEMGARRLTALYRVDACEVCDPTADALRWVDTIATAIESEGTGAA